MENPEAVTIDSASLRRADTALYSSKSAGGGRFSFYSGLADDPNP